MISLAKRYSEKQFAKDTRAENKSFKLNHFKYIRNEHPARQTGEPIDDWSIEEIHGKDKTQNKSKMIFIQVDFPERF